MRSIKTKAIERIEDSMGKIDKDTMRYRALQNAKNFKTSWIDLGQILYAVWKDKLYKDWGYDKFDTYLKKEIGIKKQTALKLLRSYYFLENEEPHYINKSYNEEAAVSTVPTYDSVDVLRLARNRKDMDTVDYSAIRKKVLEEGRSAQEVKKEITSIIKQHEELQPEQARQKKRLALLKRLVGTLKSVRVEIAVSKMLPTEVLKETDRLINKIESEIF